MRDTVIIGVACAIAIGVGAWLYLSGTTAPGLPPLTGPMSVRVVAEGQNAGTVTERKNFRIKSEEERDSLWRMVYGTGGPVIDPVDFSREEMIAVFDGSHSTGGFDVEIVAVEDTASARTIVIRRIVPGESCITTSAITNPFIIAVVPKTALPIQRIEQTEVTECN